MTLCVQFEKATGMITGVVRDSLGTQRTPIPLEGRDSLTVADGTIWEGMRVDLTTLELVPISDA